MRVLRVLLGVLSILASCWLLFVAILFRVTGLNPQQTGLNHLEAEPTQRFVIYVQGLSLSGWQLHALNAGLFVAGVVLLFMAVLAFRGKGSAD